MFHLFQQKLLGKLVTCIKFDKENADNTHVVKQPKASSPVVEVVEVVEPSSSLVIVDQPVYYTDYNYDYDEHEALERAIRESLMDVQNAPSTGAVALPDSSTQIFVDNAGYIVDHAVAGPSGLVSVKSQPDLRTLRAERREAKYALLGDLAHRVKRARIEFVMNLYTVMKNERSVVPTSKLMLPVPNRINRLADPWICFFCSAAYPRSYEQVFKKHLYGHLKEVMLRPPAHCTSPIFSGGEVRLRNLVIRFEAHQNPFRPVEMASLKVRQWINLYTCMITQMGHLSHRNERPNGWCQVCTLFRGHRTLLPRALPPKKKPAEQFEELEPASDDDYVGEVTLADDDDLEVNMNIAQAIDHLCQHTAYWRYVCNLCLKKEIYRRFMVTLEPHFITPIGTSYQNTFSNLPNYRILTGNSVNGGGCLFTVLTPEVIKSHMANYHFEEFFNYDENTSVVAISRFCAVVAVEQALGRFALDAGFSPSMLAEDRDDYTMLNLHEMLKGLTDN